MSETPANIANPSPADDAPAPLPARPAGAAGGLFGPLQVRDEHLRALASIPGADEEPWDALLSTLGAEEHGALQALANRCGLPYDSEPLSHPSSTLFFEKVPADVARQHQIAGIHTDGRSMTVVTSQPMQPAVFALSSRMLGMPITIVLSPRAQVANLINRGYEQKQDS